MVYLEDCCGDNTIFLESCGLHLWPFCRFFYQGWSSQRALCCSWLSVWTTFEPEASPAFGHCFVLFIIILSLLPLRHLAGSKTSPLSKFFVFEVSLLRILMRLGLLICRLLVSCYNHWACLWILAYLTTYDTWLSWASRACKPTHLDKEQFLRGHFQFETTNSSFTERGILRQIWIRVSVTECFMMNTLCWYNTQILSVGNGENRTSDWHTFVKLPISHTDLSFSSMCFVLKMTNYKFLVCDICLGQDQVCALTYHYISFFFMLEAMVLNYTQFV